MKKRICTIAVLAVGVAAHAAVVVNLIGDDNVTSTTFTFDEVGESTFFRDENSRKGKGTSVVENSLSGAAGAFSVTLTATDYSKESDASTWSFGPQTAVIDRAGKGWGVKSSDDEGGAAQMSAGEAMLVRFDVSDLNLEPGNRLVFSVQTKDAESYRIYKRIGAQSAVVGGIFQATDAGYSPAVTVDGMYEFAIADAGYDGGQELRVTGFSIDVRPAVSGGSVSEKQEIPEAAKTLGLLTACIDGKWEFCTPKISSRDTVIKVAEATDGARHEQSARHK